MEAGGGEPAAGEQLQEGGVIPRASRSMVWRYYEDCYNGRQVKCKLCAQKGKEAKYVITDHRTTSIRENLMKKHKNEFDDLKAEEETCDTKAGKKQKINPKQPTLFQHIQQFQKIHKQGAR